MIPAPMQLVLPGIPMPKPTHTEAALRHDLWTDDTGAYLQVIGVWTGRFSTLVAACSAAEAMGLV